MLGHPVKVNVLDMLRNVKLVIGLQNCIYAINGQMNGRKYTQFQKQLSYDGDLSPCQV